MRYKIGALFIFLLLQFTTTTITLDLGYFTIEVPQNWKYVEQQGIDSFVGRIELDQKDELQFDLGAHSNSLSEQPDFIISNDSLFIPTDMHEKRNSLAESKYKFYKLRSRKNIDELYKQDFLYEIIDGRNAKITFPKQTGNGVTGVYFDNISLKENGHKLQISGENLSRENQEKFLLAIRSIKFSK